MGKIKMSKDLGNKKSGKTYPIAESTGKALEKHGYGKYTPTPKKKEADSE